VAKRCTSSHQALRHGSCSWLFFGSYLRAHIAQNAAGDYTAGTTALSTVAEEVAKYIPIVVQLCYAIAGVVAILGAISVYIAMNNEEQDVKNILVLQNAFEKDKKANESKYAKYQCFKR
jgi:hypothetical protein